VALQNKKFFLAWPQLVSKRGHLCFALYRVLGDDARTGRSLTVADLPYPQYPLVLLVLWEDDRVTVGRLGERCSSTRMNTIAPAERRLEPTVLSAARYRRTTTPCST